MGQQDFLVPSFLMGLSLQSASALVRECRQATQILILSYFLGGGVLLFWAFVLYLGHRDRRERELKRESENKAVKEKRIE